MLSFLRKKGEFRIFNSSISVASPSCCVKLIDGMEENNKKLKLFARPSEYVYLIVGAFVAAIGAAVFYTPGHITGGGATGIGTIFYFVFHIDQGLVMMVVNIILFVIGVHFFGIRYGIKALIGSTLLSIFVSLIGSITNYDGILDYTDRMNVLMSAIFGGVCMGIGIGLVLKSGCNTGGTDIVAQVICHFTPLSFGSVQFLFNGIIVACGGFVMGLEGMLFSIIAMYISSQAVNFVLLGFGTNLAKALYVISEYHTSDIAHRVIKELHRSGTILHGTGIYTAKNKEVLFVIVPNQQLQRITRIINEEDPKAFVLVTPAYEVLGNGFESLKKVADKEN